MVLVVSIIVVIIFHALYLKSSQKKWIIDKERFDNDIKGLAKEGERLRRLELYNKYVWVFVHGNRGTHCVRVNKGDEQLIVDRFILNYNIDVVRSIYEARDRHKDYFVTDYRSFLMSKKNEL